MKTADDVLFSALLLNENHVLHQLLPPVKCTQYNLRNRPHNYTLPKVNNNYIKTILCSECYTKTFINLTNLLIFTDSYFSYFEHCSLYLYSLIFFQCEIGAFVTYVIKRYLLTYLNGAQCLDSNRYKSDSPGQIGIFAVRSSHPRQTRPQPQPHAPSCSDATRPANRTPWHPRQDSGPQTTGSWLARQGVDHPSLSSPSVPRRMERRLCQAPGV